MKVPICTDRGVCEGPQDGGAWFGGYEGGDRWKVS